VGDKMGITDKALDEWIQDTWVEEIQKEIDREILENIVLTNDHWVSVPYDNHELTYEKFKEITAWADEHSNGEIKMKNSRWWFKDPNDKVLFLLRWSGWL
jgi:hypothetical protein